MPVIRSVLCGSILVLTATAAPAQQQQCDRWIAEMQEDEGGPAMMASICTDHPASPGVLLVQCAGSEGLGFRYQPGIEAGAPSDVPDFQGPFHLKSSMAAMDIDLTFEGMDGAYATYVPASGPLMKMLKSGGRLTVSGPAGAFKPETFPLEGASEAIAKVEAACDA